MKEYNNKNQNPQMLQEAGIYTVAETESVFLFVFLTVYLFPSLYGMIHISVARLFRREELQSVRGNCCLGVGVSWISSPLHLSKTPTSKSPTHFLSLSRLCPG